MVYMTRTLLLLLLIFTLGTECGKIINLPGAPTVTFDQYSGYYTVGPMYSHHMHYWFIESQNNPATDPLILWLTGGPGCSGLAALLTEWGPFMVNPDGTTLRKNPYAWNRNASILTLESPSGVGYSYTDDGDLTSDDDKTSFENYQALLTFLEEFPQFRKNDFYVIGESYGGMYVPTLVQRILDSQSQFKINVKGLAIGNGVLEHRESVISRVLFVYSHGLIDDSLWQRVRTECCNNNTDTCPFWSFNETSFCGGFTRDAVMIPWNSGLNPYNLYAQCSNSSILATPKMLIELGRTSGKKPRPEYYGGPACTDVGPLTMYLNRPDVRKALFIPSDVYSWEICNSAVDDNYSNIYETVAPHIHNAISAGLNVLLYSGDVDMACDFLGTQRFARLLGYPLTQEATKYIVEDQIGGLHTLYGEKLHVATVRGSGHQVPADKPAAAYHILSSFLNDNWGDSGLVLDTSGCRIINFLPLLLMYVLL